MKAIKGTRQVTKAMELVAASKMRKAVQNAVQLRRYALGAWNVLRRLSLVSNADHPFLRTRPVEKVLCILLTSDRGLCGSLNAHLFKKTATYLREVQTRYPAASVEFVAAGRKGQQFLSRLGHKVVAAFPAFSNHPRFKDVLPICRLALDGFIKGQYDHVVLVYTDFISALVQEPAIKVLLPFSTSDLQAMIESISQDEVTPDDIQAVEGVQNQKEYTFEPSQAQVLNEVIPSLTEVQIYQAVLESAASEHSARMVAMRNATDNASEILGDLTLTYNQTRQAGITAELSELSAAVAVLG
jgi:F-type H+-transporting ATPase subunit gamma